MLGSDLEQVGRGRSAILSGGTQSRQERLIGFGLGRGMHVLLDDQSHCRHGNYNKSDGQSLLVLLQPGQDGQCQVR